MSDAVDAEIRRQLERSAAIEARKAGKQPPKLQIVRDPLPSPPEPARAAAAVAPARETPPEKQRGSPPVLGAEPLRSAPLPKTEGLTILPADAPHLRLPYVVLEALRTLKPSPRAVMEELYRAAAGWHSDECVISVGKLSKHCQIKPTQVREHLKVLESKGLVSRLGEVVGGSDLDARGIRFRVNLPRLTPPEKQTPSENRPRRKTEANKENALNKESKVGSCDRCKESPGWFYPEGIGKGSVVKCDHREGKG